MDMDHLSKSPGKERRSTIDKNETAPAAKKHRADKSIQQSSTARQLQLLMIEKTILTLDIKVKTCLNVNNARPNTKQCIAILKRYRQQPITALMLKKHPHLVDSIKRVRNYVGQIDKWKLSEHENDEFRAQAAQIRECADDLYAKFQKLFRCEQDRKFETVFGVEVQRWQKYCKRFRINGERLVTLTIDPMRNQNSNEFTQDEILAALNDSVGAKGRRYASLEVELNLDTEIRLLENRCKLFSAAANQRQKQIDKFEHEIHILHDERLQCFVELYQKRRERIELMDKSKSQL